MGKNKTAVIIGAGIGGLTTAVYLAREGYKVRVYEKNPSPGGRCGQIKRDGYRFDLGATMVLMPGIYHEVFKSLNIKLEEGKDLIPLENLYRIWFDNNSFLDFTTDNARMKEQLEKTEPGSYQNYRKYIAKGYEIFTSSMTNLIDRNFYNLFQLVNFRNIPFLFRIKAFTPHFDYARKYFRHPHLLMAFTFQNIYVGQSPFNSPALFSMVPAAELTEGSFFPSAGGLFSIPEKLYNAASESGVEFNFSSPVKKIMPEGNKAGGIELDDGTVVNADIIVANADLPYVYRELLPGKRMSKHLDSLKYSCSAICFHWGMDKTYPFLDHHNVFLSDGFREGLDRIFRDKSVSDVPSFYVHAPARSDPSAAPEGCDALSVIVAAGHLDPRFRQEWDEIVRRTRKSVISRLKKLGLEDFEEHIKTEICLTPADWQNICNISRGSVFGSLGHNILQMGYFRPHNRHDKYLNVYFVGGSTHPGNGIPNVLISAKLVSERILKETHK
ncbi:MAG: phytoene desaturase [Bacteroidales bacterium]|jgi:phytoene desaturase|nr:phytoene desaturase [Bacteroidales bacterium]